MANILAFPKPVLTAPAALRPLALDAAGVAKTLGLSLRTVRSHDAAGTLPKPVRIGGRVVWITAELERWLEAGAPDRATWEAVKAARLK